MGEDALRESLADLSSSRPLENDASTLDIVGRSVAFVFPRSAPR
jgi:hypothetical protein